jgi:ribosomal-protein-alanine N-acetyltransferase
LITSDSDVTRYLSFGPTREAEVRGLIDFAVASSQAIPRTDYALAVVRVSDDALVGSCGLAIDPGALDSAEVYLVLRADVWGQGLASELLPALLALGFERLDVQRIFGVAHPDNTASQRVMAKCGMTLDGRVPDAFEGVHGWLEGDRYAILRA